MQSTTRTIRALATVTQLLIVLAAFQLSASAQGTAFTYQGRLNANGVPANGSYDLRCALYDAASAGGQQGNALTNVATAVSNGLFTITLDFGNQFPGADRWLEVAVRTNGGGAFTALVPRQLLTPSPYAITAGRIVAGGIPAGTYSGAVTFNNSANSFVGNFAGNGGGLTNVNATTLGGLGASSFWQVGGNGGTTPGSQFVGTTDNQALELKVAGARALRLEPNASVAPNVIGGASFNTVGAGAVGATIGGGGAENYFGFFTYTNRIDADFGTIAGGINNRIHLYAPYGFIGGGEGNTVETNSNYAAVSGGLANLIRSNAAFSSIGGGVGNLVGLNGGYSTIAGGYFNQIKDSASLILEDGMYATMGGGKNNLIGHGAVYSTVAGGNGNRIEPIAPYASIGGGQSNVIEAFTANGVIGGGYRNDLAGDHSVIGGGQLNVISFSETVIGGGQGNVSRAIGGTIGGGIDNYQASSSYYGTIGGGASNTNGGLGSMVPGGVDNYAAGDSSLAAGQRAKALHQGAFVWADSKTEDFASTTNNEFNIRAQNGVRIECGKGIHLNATNQPLITVDFNVFATNAPASKVGVGRWGLFKEQNALVVGLPPATEDGGKTFQVATYSTNGTPTMLMMVNQYGDVFGAGSMYAQSFNPSSDRNAKENFAPVSTREILDKVVALPVTTWNFKQEGTRHIGPMAQDFYVSFEVGPDAKHIATVDADGVALAAIQGLNQKLTGELKQKQTEIEDLKQRLDKLERILYEKN